MDLIGIKTMTPLRVALANREGLENVKIQILDDLGDPEKKEDRYVYLLEDEELDVFKIGVSKYPRWRAKDLKSQYGYNFRLILKVNLQYRSVCYASENYLHNIFAHKRYVKHINNSKEYFAKLTDEDIEIIEYTLKLVESIVVS